MPAYSSYVQVMYALFEMFHRKIGNVLSSIFLQIANKTVTHGWVCKRINFKYIFVLSENILM